MSRSTARGISCYWIGIRSKVATWTPNRTLPRFENGVGVKELYRMGEALAVSLMRRHGKRLRRRAYRVTILDPTCDPTHVAQQLSFFNGHYDNWRYLPVLGFVSFNSEVEPYSPTQSQ